jgi:hypothetical protein
MPSGVRKLIRAKLRHVATRAVLVLAAVTVLLAVVRGGTRFFYCPMTHLVFDAPPCSSPADEADDSAPAVRTPDCCEEKWRPAAPTGSVPQVHETTIAPPPLVAILGHAELAITEASTKLPFSLSQAARAGPSPPPAGKRRAQLMIFHI